MGQSWIAWGRAGGLAVALAACSGSTAEDVAPLVAAPVDAGAEAEQDASLDVAAEDDAADGADVAQDGGQDVPVDVAPADAAREAADAAGADVDAGPTCADYTPCSDPAQAVRCDTVRNGCGDAVACSPCAAPQTCGGGGYDGACGQPLDGCIAWTSTPIAGYVCTTNADVHPTKWLWCPIRTSEPPGCTGAVTFVPSCPSTRRVCAGLF